MKNIIAAIALSSLAVAGTISITSPAYAESVAAPSISGDFIKKQKSIKGSWEVIQRGDQTVIKFGDDFRAKKGPDLKVFLSPASVSDVNGKTATNGSLLLGELTSTKGGQEYILPAGVNIEDYGSVLVHCEAYSVLWGGGEL